MPCGCRVILLLNFCLDLFKLEKEFHHRPKKKKKSLSVQITDPLLSTFVLSEQSSGRSGMPNHLRVQCKKLFKVKCHGRRLLWRHEGGTFKNDVGQNRVIWVTCCTGDASLFCFGLSNVPWWFIFESFFGLKKNKQKQGGTRKSKNLRNNFRAEFTGMTCTLHNTGSVISNCFPFKHCFGQLPFTLSENILGKTIYSLVMTVPYCAKQRYIKAKMTELGVEEFTMMYRIRRASVPQYIC